MPRPLVATIDIAALRHNLNIAQKNAPNAKTWAVVKANAYGHGLLRGLRGFADADGLALVEIEGAVQLRQAGWQKRILLVEGFFDTGDLSLIAEHQLDFVVHDITQVEMLEQAKLPGKLNIHMKINSGMNRLGFTPRVSHTVYQRLHAIPTVRTISFLTHFANAEESDNSKLSVAEQMRRFEQATADLPGKRCLSNSAGDLLHPECAADWIRPGIMLYGATPAVDSAQSFGLRPAMTLRSELIGIQHLEIGDSVGYGSQFVADKEMRIGVVACGYADGYPRHAPTGTPVLVDGIKTHTVGRVSMDMITVDLTPIPNAHIGSKVILWGVGLPIDDVANAAGTVGYELMCAITDRVKIIESGN